MTFSRNLFFGKSKYLVGMLFLSLISLCCLAFSSVDDDNYSLATREVLLRKIGHEILLQSGDSTSRVLPVKKIAEDEYEISFEKELTFQTDSLVNSIQKLLAKDASAKEYIVNVLNCDNSVAYGFAISKNKKDEIIACIGRKQPKSCYIINIKFKSNTIITAKKEYFLGGISLLAFVGFIVSRSVKPRKSYHRKEENKIITFGSLVFDAQKRKLEIDKNSIDLTGTETRLLLIFALSPNETIERSRLQKEIWEDEGVIVGRSLDMFISKLRKKLEPDPNCAILVVRSKGYKLEVKSL